MHVGLPASGQIHIWLGRERICTLVFIGCSGLQMRASGVMVTAKRRPCGYYSVVFNLQPSKWRTATFLPRVGPAQCVLSVQARLRHDTNTSIALLDLEGAGGRGRMQAE